jgi:excinuclease UvrABC nuclease subunit
LALVTRKRCPIYIAQPIIEKAGISLDFFISALEECDDSFDDEDEEIASLKRQLERAVSREEYELAAIIRDKLKVLEK